MNDNKNSESISYKDNKNLTSTSGSDNQKLDPELALALDMTESQRERSSQLETGYDPREKIWRVIVKHAGDLQEVESLVDGVQAISLYNGYGILRVPAGKVEQIGALPQILYVEKPKELYFSLDTGRSVSCINSVWQQEPLGMGLTGTGVIVGIADSGIDIFHPAFRKEDGSSRILFLWDQTAPSLKEAEYVAPHGYSGGIEWKQEQLNKILSGELTWESLPQGVTIPTDTTLAHGTAVAGIAAGNGRIWEGERYRGVATESPLIVVKLGSGKEGFPRTTEVMEALDYMMRQAIALEMPIALNLSFGNNIGAHNGDSLLEQYIRDLAGLWKNAVCIASGNEGEARHHVSLQLESRMTEVPIAIAAAESSLGLQLYKNYVDDFALFLESPEGKRQLIDKAGGQTRQYSMVGNEIFVYYGEPSPYTESQEIYVQWLPGENQQFLTEGTWKILLVPEIIIKGNVDLWLPTVEVVGLSTGFLKPSPDTTLTIPATAANIITVGAYRQSNDSVATFSGRGNTADNRSMPTLVAPGVDVLTAAPGGRYLAKTGTSMAAPFVTGSCALLMEWGIVRGNDPYLYGEKLKAYLQKGARHLPGFTRYPNPQVGYGALCVKKSFPGGN